MAKHVDDRDRRSGLVLPHASPAANREMAMDQNPTPADIPWERMMYRTSGGLLLTSSLISLGIGAGQHMTGVSRLTEEEAHDYIELLDAHVKPEVRTPFEREIACEIAVKLKERWT